MGNVHQLQSVAGRTFMVFLFLAVAAAGVPGAPGGGASVPTGAPPAATGLQTRLPVDVRAFKTPHDYFTTSVQRKVFAAYKTHKGMGSLEANRPAPEQCLAYEEGQTTVVYVPAGYDGVEPYGVYLHNSPSKEGIHPPQPWQDLMDKLKLIYISPNGGGNEAADLRRVVLALDSLASVKHRYKINDERVYVGGLSGGGYVGMLCQMFYPELFHGAISHAAQSYLPTVTRTGHFAGLTLADVKSGPRSQRKWVVISGEKDKNYHEILDTSREWVHARLPYRFINVPGMGHQNAAAEALEEALLWVGAAPGAPARPPAGAGTGPGPVAGAGKTPAPVAASPLAPSADVDPQAEIITADSKRAHKTGTWLESSKIVFQGRPTTFTRQAGATIKYRLEYKRPTRATIFLYTTADGGRYGDPHMKVTVVHKGLEAPFELDCTQGTTGWHELGTFDFNGTGPEYVQVTRVSPDSENVATRAIAVKSKIVPLTADAR